MGPRQARRMLVCTVRQFLLCACLALPVTSSAAPPMTAPDPSRSPAASDYGMVATAHPIASAAGAAVLEQGGNAVDAALAAVYVLDVVTGYSLGLGGGEFWVIHLAAQDCTLTIDGRETAPAGASRTMYLAEEGEVVEGRSTLGVLAGGVPGSVEARRIAREQFATLDRARLLAPAIRAAQSGFMLDELQAKYHGEKTESFKLFPTTAAVMLEDDGTAYDEGDLFRQPQLAATLNRIVEHGERDFYEGAIAREIAGFMQREGGLITLEDLENYRAVLREPVRGTYRGHEIASMPPPSSGGVHLIQMLNILEGWTLAGYNPASAEYLHLLGETMELAFADRAEFLGDPVFVDVPTGALTDKAYADTLRRRILPLKDVRVQDAGHPREVVDNPPELAPSHTSHLSVMDRWGNTVALTSSINTHFGSKVILGSTGVFLNNTMDDFSIKPGYPNVYGLVGSEANAIEPGKRPLSSMTPTLVFRDGVPILAAGAAGGPRIITATLQTVLNVLDHGMDVQSALDFPRVHHQWKPDVLYLEKSLRIGEVRKLENMGHRVKRGYSGGVAQAVHYIPSEGTRYGGADPRAMGVAMGVDR